MKGATGLLPLNFFENYKIEKIPVGIIFVFLCLGQTAFTFRQTTGVLSEIETAAEKVLRKQILKEAAWAIKQEPLKVTAFFSPRSAGGKHDFFSDDDYFWPDAKNPEGPYIDRDGMTNPDNFVDHRNAMIRFRKVIGALASAYKLSGDEKYVKQAVIHLKAWFINPQTLMNPNLLMLKL